MGFAFFVVYNVGNRTGGIATAKSHGIVICAALSCKSDSIRSVSNIATVSLQVFLSRRAGLCAFG